ncbi:hypothetical protein CSKR_100803 [Clonorchis sinensis]|uniref:Uncharacterized protein n=1 Tax=Clonorchis sinensis TaxID=79923 RepID=A0A3R7FS89_CLOSI|nr:hypothetical protein CSKR_100803 [Clonorchis sinensis]
MPVKVTEAEFLTFLHPHKAVAYTQGSNLRLRWLEREFTDWKIRGSNPNSASRLLLTRLGRPDSISALVLPSGGLAARHRKGATAGRLSGSFHRASSQLWDSF